MEIVALQQSHGLVGIFTAHGSEQISVFADNGAVKLLQMGKRLHPHNICTSDGKRLPHIAQTGAFVKCLMKRGIQRGKLAVVFRAKAKILPVDIAFQLKKHVVFKPGSANLLHHRAAQMHFHKNALLHTVCRNGSYHCALLRHGTH